MRRISPQPPPLVLRDVSELSRDTLRFQSVTLGEPLRLALAVTFESGEGASYDHIASIEIDQNDEARLLAYLLARAGKTAVDDPAKLKGQERS